MKKKLFVLAVFLLAMTIYFVFYHKDKTLKFVPKNADVIVLVDVKNLTRQYISSFVTNPSQWFGTKKTKENTISIYESGVKIPDFLQIFHLQNTKISDWYSVVELKDKKKFLAFLKQEKFIEKSENIFQRDNFFVKIEEKSCMFGTADVSFNEIHKVLFQNSKNDIFNADSFIDGSLGSISFISGARTRNFSIDVLSDEIEIKSISTKDFSSLIAKLQQKNTFLETELDGENLKKLTSSFDKNMVDSSHINYLKATATLEQVNDTIISYGYDDNFNEVEKKTFQKIIQPNYMIALQSSNSDETEQFFRNKKWINAQNQFTAIPFQPNLIQKNKNNFEIKSTRKQIPWSANLNGNYIFIRNNALLLSSLKMLNANEKKLISNLDYIFYGNNAQDYFFKLKFKKEELPLILRW
ncbi:hypothetical protein ASG22_10125 [Chryseobacterium sp. Leaf405]|uniref:hypothetical protein n=1 Tax=Chryseobacterium sp. Leaf405 TaxID=1736367 RepID=UPI000700038D|nr:hypothetical protein [Chryseobacterium sp. Leaf405]KQT24358.1 hypothetical protein ASG22_10125 [Chryseobacterium sp. Leaf405]